MKRFFVGADWPTPPFQLWRGLLFSLFSLRVALRELDRTLGCMRRSVHTHTSDILQQATGSEQDEVRKRFGRRPSHGTLRKCQNCEYARSGNGQPCNNTAHSFLIHVE